MSDKLVIQKSIRIEAAAEMVWQTLTKPDTIKQWLGTQVTSDWKVGSPLRFSFIWEGKQFEDKGQILQFDPPLAFAYSYWSELSGLPDEPKNYSHVSFVVAPHETCTMLTLQHDHFSNHTMYEHSDQNWKETLMQIKTIAEQPAHVTTVTRTGATQITVQATFTAPPSKVFAGLTQPDLLRQWMVAAGRELVECHVDLRSGGSFRYLFKFGNDRTFGMYGDYREVVPERRIVHTEAYDGYDWKPLVTSMDLSENAGGTGLVMVILYPTKEICDEDFPNIAEGTPEGFARLNRLLTSL